MRGKASVCMQLCATHCSRYLYSVALYVVVILCCLLKFAKFLAKCAVRQHLACLPPPHPHPEQAWCTRAVASLPPVRKLSFEFLCIKAHAALRKSSPFLFCQVDPASKVLRGCFVIISLQAALSADPWGALCCWVAVLLPDLIEVLDGLRYLLPELHVRM